MNKYRGFSKMWFLALLLVTFVAGCASNGQEIANIPNIPDTIAPTVSVTSPANGDVAVPVNRKIAVAFSEVMAPASITTATFALKETVSGTNVPGAVTPVGTSATFAPSAALKLSTNYTATIKGGASGVKDLAGNAMVSDFVFTFTTGLVADIDIIAPTVSVTSPTDTAVAVPVNRIVTVGFSEVMDPATIGAASFTLKETVAGTNVPGTVTRVGTSALFTPTSNLSGSTGYTATIKGGAGGAKDLAGNALAADFVWNFTTAAAADTVLPAVTATVPVNLATGVALNGTANSTFSEAIDPLTITSATFKLAGPGAASVTGAVGYNALTKIATFTPASPLAAGTSYTATITTGVKDLAGNAPAANKVWSFTTAAAVLLGPAPVLLGSAGNYVILATSGVSAVPASVITGDVGLSPAATSFLTGFSLTMVGTTSAISPQVTGNLYGADMSPPASSNLTTAVSDMGTAYTDAAGRPTPDFLNEGAGEIGGKTLLPGLYKWTTGVTISTDVTVSGGPNDVWIFQIPGNLTMSTAKKVVLSGGAQAKNIFWQVAGTVNIGAAAHFEGIILCQTSITLGTGASMNGMALAQTAVMLDASTVTKPN